MKVTFVMMCLKFHLFMFCFSFLFGQNLNVSRIVRWIKLIIISLIYNLYTWFIHAYWQIHNGTYMLLFPLNFIHL